MPQPNDLSRSLVALDQDSTIIAVVEMSQSSWLVAGMLPGIERQPEHAPHDGAQRRRGGSSGSSWCRGPCGPAIVSYGGGAKCRPVFEAP
jgi:hypothetical protein